MLAGDHAFGRPGNDLLSRALRHSTIGARGLHGRVRNGIGCGPPAIATRSSKRMVCRGWCNNPDERTPGVRFNTENLSYRNNLCRRTLPLYAAVYCRSFYPGGSGPEGSCKRPTIKPIEQLVLVSFTCCHASTSSLSTWWSSTALMRDLVSRWASRLDAFSGYPFRT